MGRSSRVNYLHAPEEIRTHCGERIILEKEPPKSINGTMGSHVFMLRTKSVEELFEQSGFILQHADGKDWDQ